MRLLLYILAMMTGVSAAEAARPVAEAPVAVAQRAVVAGVIEQTSSDERSASPGRHGQFEYVNFPVDRRASLILTESPVSRHDIIRQ